MHNKPLSIAAMRDRSPLGTPTLMKDSEECTMSDLSAFPPGTYVGDPYYSVNGVPYTWLSDCDARRARLVTLIVTDNGDGTSHLDVVAYY